MGNVIDFSIKVWMTVIFIAPLAFNILNSSFLFDLYFFAVAFGILFSLPAMILFLVFTYFIDQLTIRTILKKLLLVCLGLITTYITFHYLNFHSVIVYAYCTTLTVAIFIFKLESPADPQDLTGIKN